MPDSTFPEGMTFLGIDPAYHTSVGRFIDMFSRVEMALFFALAKTSGVSLTTAQAIFADARVDKAKDSINRLRAAHGMPEDPALSRAFQQLGEIARFRNNLVHYGVTRDAEADTLTVTNVLFIPPNRTPQREPISVEILEAMIWDLQTIRTALNNLWSPPSHHLPPEFAEQRRQLAMLPWRHKPHAPSHPVSGTRGRRRARKHPPLS